MARIIFLLDSTALENSMTQKNFLNIMSNERKLATEYMVQITAKEKSEKL